MSLILDALSKSEQERQIASGQSFSMPYPIEIKRSGKQKIVLTLLVLQSIIILILVVWLWPHPVAIEPSGSAAVNTPVIAAASKILEATPDKYIPVIINHDVANAATPHIQHIPHAPHNSQSHVEAKITSPAANAKETGGGDPLKGLPKLDIGGYIHNQESGNMVMINNKLVHEGEELSPGLRLVKILDNSTIFSYNGYVFSR